MMNIPLRLLRWAVHVTAGGLLVIAVLTALRDGNTMQAAGGALLGLLYAAGAPIGRWWPQARPVWLGLVTAGWAVLAVGAAPFVWLAFPLLFAYLDVLPLWGAMFGVGALTSAAILVAAWHAGELTLPLVVGPGVGAVVVTLLALACKALHAEMRERRPD
ncbi:hypothetical protein [Nonomuraea zeae]|uniref:Sensor histidine kinase n=1 Tax=Nonomuraea zeae TaxID=1642303 RepID=A0A5S4H360_9ACTN|nr:hypothetical protein [Nonomuraea zeae]TMR39362.1 hypothetical protein ETD85_01540 [Nonomuraea zeae]